MFEVDRIQIRDSYLCFWAQLSRVGLELFYAIDYLYLAIVFDFPPHNKLQNTSWFLLLETKEI